ncbi:hypothetical protein SBV1_gp04 [Sulfolobales Beppu virus 1]|nr:hypothetical protein SBV1_gp04 [Sulfolobales Beppu virus 1]
MGLFHYLEIRIFEFFGEDEKSLEIKNVSREDLEELKNHLADWFWHMVIFKGNITEFHFDTEKDIIKVILDLDEGEIRVKRCPK